VNGIEAPQKWSATSDAAAERRVARTAPAMFQPPSTPETRMAVRKVSYTVQRAYTLPRIAQR